MKLSKAQITRKFDQICSVIIVDLSQNVSHFIPDGIIQNQQKNKFEAQHGRVTSID